MAVEYNGGVVPISKFRDLERENEQLKRLVEQKTAELATIKGDCNKIKMDYEIVKEALRITTKKTDAAVKVARTGKYPKARIASAFGVSRPNLHRRLKADYRPRQRRRRADESLVFKMISDVVKEHVTYGYRRVTAVVRRFFKINHKRVYRIMRENNFLREKYRRKVTRTHTGKVATPDSNLRWCSDGFRIMCKNGEHVEVAFVLDCHDREAIDWVCSVKGISSDMVCSLMLGAVEKRFQADKLPHSIQWLSDNGPGYVARKSVNFAKELGLQVCTTPPYSPQSNGMAEAFVKSFKRDYVRVNDLFSASEVMNNLSEWFECYNEFAPHKALNMMSPRGYLRSRQAA